MDNLLDLFSFEGRANRAWYFWHILLDDLVMFTLATVFAVLMFVTGTPLFAVPLAGVVIGGIWAGVAVTVKRLHDLDRRLQRAGDPWSELPRGQGLGAARRRLARKRALSCLLFIDLGRPWER